ncbi:hypothetical protein CGCF415_v001352 [Colletotrichum fructicola]|uniref:Uncharacterized protein n=1 Tax=Colletotrichum fructicola (strain Nara gc5) TaxID=1213859 RepID=L2FUD2_COLFN|nr:uncharacterized protein CGMCC3_g8499 [Colletotrichum fructicola]KAF4484759.1 hypothetical protein CGGC5_v007444 [Colletotrichum fructicola Nara gc5]KAE9575565.1 hypothetical protein CGMCC3_g8499 [Colletotrichum fructicola]KAF4411536.1 hypothetical protein CFRS1_v006249 [Colletotrichum fructicola]KAF4905404.1 hypothetical protein CGCFRS4_v000738 [Colletotrichum fructicola]KAF4915834.1 hypothetical protein CGCF415_v001352 [Colletotrichum fructicola]
MSYSSNRHHFRSGNGSSTSSQTEVRTSRRQTAIIDVEDQREIHRWTYGPRQEEDYLDEQDLEHRRRRSPTPSHVSDPPVLHVLAERNPVIISQYETDCENPEYRFLLASDVRRQVRQAPSYHGGNRGYPHQYFNRERLPVRSEASRYEHPIMPSPGEGRELDNWRPGLIPGPVRAIYNEDDRTVFEVGYHERSAAPSGPHVGARQSNTPFRLARYHPTVDYRDEDENRRS